MPIMKNTQTPGNRVDQGNTVIERAKNLDTSSVKARLAAFAKMHASYVKAARAVEEAQAKWRQALSMIGERDVDQDEDVDALALALANDGAPRTAPFKGLSKYSPSALKDLAYEAEAREIRALAAKVLKRKGASKSAISAARKCISAADALDRAIKRAKGPEKSYQTARATRDALERPWETAYASLKRGARFADEEGTAKGIYKALFEAQTSAPRKKRAKTPPAPPA